MTSRLRTHIFFGLFGLLMGMSLTFIGFADYGELHRMFVFADLRMLLVFAGSVALSMVGYAILTRGVKLPPKPLHRGSIAGGILFGLGWVLTGACPSTAVVQLGAGHLSALITMAGIASGVWTYPWVHARYFRWDTGACEV